MNLPLPPQYQAKEKEPSAYTRKIGSCMTYRSDIVWIDITDKSQDILTLIKTHKNFDYFPVCASKIDAVIGIVSARDYLQSRFETPPPNLQKVLTKPLFIPESQTIKHTLELLNEHNTHSACVIDEYGGIEGFITKDGLLESLFNRSIQSASRTGQHPVRQADGSIIVSAQMSLDEIQAIGLLNDIERHPTEEYYTLAGYLLAHLDAIPRLGDSIDTGSYICTVLGMHGQRIDQVAIKKKEA
ncbi:transporter associated domain-containing protein [Treponema sp. OMZ 855]|uniref:transporter associated domain-containing protein n=1 Tax=Treponema sp. OMZ 855 TaxID=1643512 RepID=UPI0020A3B715|nr:transporter associated domain-containing protein [Treponema sp. OMZ 855]UTC50093.1 CBS domain-containing protein [Treponema sp. OMZ 855]